MSEQIITRFAPSPTGLLHIGSARTALFNWLFAKSVGGKFLLRIEDTDTARSTQVAVDAILDSMKWLGLFWDGDIVFQSKRIARHKEVAQMLLMSGYAYRCYMTQEEIEDARAASSPLPFRSIWRDKSEILEGKPYTVRLKAPLTGETAVDDVVHGTVHVQNSTLDDMVLLRSDGTPTYMLAVVVDDHDMSVNHVIRGDDHFTNTFRQLQIYELLGWPRPVYAHIPLIHGPDGAKLSKRHGALGVGAYKDMGYLPDAMCNYLLRLGWGKENIELIKKEDAAKIFSLSDLVKSPARFDIDKLNYINTYYINNTKNDELLSLISEMSEISLPESTKEKILRGMDALKARAHTIKELADISLIYLAKKEELDDKSKGITEKYSGSSILEMLFSEYSACDNWSLDNLRDIGASVASKNDIKPTVIMQILRAFVLGTFASPGIYEVIEILGKAEVLERMKR